MRGPLGGRHSILFAGPPGLDRAQELRLKVEGELANLVEEQRASRRLFERANPSNRCSSEGPFLVSPTVLPSGARARSPTLRAGSPWYIIPMDDDTRQRRARAATRVIRLHEDDGAFDRAAWQGSTMEERIAAVWELTRDCIAFQDPDAPEPRLQRSIVRLERRGR